MSIRKMVKIHLVVTLILTTSACTSDLKVSPIHYSATPITGIPYNLSFAQFDIVISSRLIKCKGINGWPTFKTTVTAAPRIENDPSMSFVIDYSELSNWMKTSDFQIKMQDNSQRIKSIGVTSEDKTGKVVVNTVGGLINLVHSAAIAAAGAAPIPVEFSACSTDSENALVEYDKQKKYLEIATGKLDQETKDLKSLTDYATALGKGMSPAIQSKLLSQAKKVSLLQVEIIQLTDKLNAASNIITGPLVKLTWPNMGSELIIDDAITKADKVKINDWILYKLLDSQRLLDKGMIPASKQADFNAKSIHSFFTPSVKIGIEPVLEKTVPTSLPNTVNGIVYRIPIKGKVMVSICKDFKQDIASVDKCEAMDAPQDILTTSVPQLGQTYLLPFHNGPLQNNLLNAEFTPDGNISSFEYAEKSSRAEVASDTFNQVASTILQGTKDITPLLSKPGLSNVDQIKAATAELQAQADFNKAKLALQPASDNDKEIATITSETALLDAQRKQIEAELALSKAKAIAP